MLWRPAEDHILSTLTTVTAIAYLRRSLQEVLIAMDASTKQQLADWLSFFEDLGFNSLYRRTPVLVSAPEAPQAAAALPSTAAATAAPPATQPSPGNLSLFEVSSNPQMSQSPQISQRNESLADIATDLGDCHRCKLAAARKHIVFGQGNPKAELLFIGEGPGADEDEQGLPFVGRAGQLLNKMLKLVEIRREDVYICNIVKCRPPGNRTPESDEIAACSPFLFRQIDAIRPRIICCLGAPAARTVLGIKEGITKIHGRIMDYRQAKALATVHPAYVLRNPREEVILRDDFAKIRDFLAASAR